MRSQRCTIMCSELYKGVKHLDNYISFRIMFVFRKGHGPIPTGGCFPIRQNILHGVFSGKGMALSLRADVSPSGKYHSASIFSERAWPYPYRRMFSHPVKSFCMVFFPERAWPYPYGRMFSHPAHIIPHLFFSERAWPFA